MTPETREAFVRFLDDVGRFLEETEQYLRDIDREQYLRDMDREVRIMRLGRAKLRELRG